MKAVQVCRVMTAVTTLSGASWRPHLRVYPVVVGTEAADAADLHHPDGNAHLDVSADVGRGGC